MANGANGKDGTDVRTLVILALFILAGGILIMVALNPALLHETSFMVLATLVFGGSGLGAVVAFLFGGTKTGSSVMESNAATIQAATPVAVVVPSHETPAETV